MKLRNVGPQDSKSLVELMSQLGYTPTESELLTTIEVYTHSSDAWVFGVEIDETLVACASYHLIPYFHCAGAMMRVTSLIVDKDHKRQGFGQALMDHAVALAKEHGCDKIELTTGGHRKGEAHPFYEANGYTPYDGVRYLKSIYP